MALLKLKNYLARYKREYLLGILSLLLTIVFGALVPWLLKYPIDFLKTEGVGPKFFLFIGLFLAAALVSGIFRFFMRRILIGISRKIEYDLRNDLFAHLQKLSVSFYNRHSTGDVMARATNDVNAVRNMLGPGIMYSLYTLFYTIFAVFMMIKIDLRLTLLALIPFPVVSFGVNRVMKHLYRYSNRVQGLFSDITARVQENISGIRIVQSYNQEENQTAQFQRVVHEYLTYNLKLSLLRGGLFAGVTLLTGSGLAIVLYFGGKDVILNRLTLGEFASFNMYLATLIWPMIAIGWVINIFQMGAASLDRILEYMNTEPDIQDSAQTSTDIHEIEGSIQLRHVYFKYNPNADFVLHDVNLSVKPGETIAIVGETGSGKTSLIHVITRLYDAARGEVLIGGVPIKRIPLRVLRKTIALVPQDDFLFSETIAENIAFCQTEPNLEAVRVAAQLASVSYEIEAFHDQYETILGERGINVSGGQKQRIAIARAIMHNPKILILDDALSAVDTVTERQIVHNLFTKLPGVTKILVTHRVTTIRDVDAIYVIDQGRIVEEGNHEELLSREGKYAELYYKQLLQEELDRIE